EGLQHCTRGFHAFPRAAGRRGGNRRRGRGEDLEAWRRGEGEPLQRRVGGHAVDTVQEDARIRAAGENSSQLTQNARPARLLAVVVGALEGDEDSLAGACQRDREEQLLLI